MTALRRAELRIFFKVLPQYVLVLLVLAATAWINDNYLEAACFAISFCVLRYRFTDILHCNTTFKCMLLTNGIVIAFIPITIPLTNSLFGGLISGFAVNFTANLIASDISRKAEQKELIQIKERLFSVDLYSMEESDLRQFCRSRGLDPIDEEIVVQRLTYHLKGQELYEKIGYSKPQMIRREKRIEEKLGIKIKDR